MGGPAKHFLKEDLALNLVLGLFLNNLLLLNLQLEEKIVAIVLKPVAKSPPVKKPNIF